MVLFPAKTDTSCTVLLYGIEKQPQPNSLTPKAIRRDAILTEVKFACLLIGSLMIEVAHGYWISLCILIWIPSVRIGAFPQQPRRICEHMWASQVFLVTWSNKLCHAVSPGNYAQRASQRIWELRSCHCTGLQVTAESVELQLYCNGRVVGASIQQKKDDFSY